jgi:predicted N-acyltransferase
MNIEIYQSLKTLPPDEWQKLTSPAFPFTHFNFLQALESSDCLGTRTGWAPVFVAVKDHRGLLAAMPLFVKTNSYGEYIFDFAWAEAHESHGLSYYPKLVSAVPFTPATGKKILFSRDLSAEERSEVAALLFQGVRQLSEKLDVSSVHALFIAEDEISLFREADYFIRHSFQFHWRNRGYGAFNDFLTSLRGKRRREIQRERKTVQEGNLDIQRLTGEQLTADHARIMHQFYLSTVDKRGGFNYLTEKFFLTVFETMKDNILFVLARNPAGLPVAGALNFFGEGTLYGRHWGCLEDYRALHFEVCYYQGIEFAIEKKFHLFEAGAQGEHKFQRGFLPSLTYSAHRIRHHRLDEAIQDFTEREKSQLGLVFSDYLEHTPFHD